MDDLVAFITARLDEDEAAAGEAPGELDSGQWPFWTEFMSTDRPCVEAAEAYRDRFPPSRVLRDVAAKRAILTEVVPAIFDLDYKLIEELALDREVEAHMALLRVLASVWSGHPDYRPEWGPESDPRES